MRPLIYLELRQFINSIKNTVRHPKRLIPMLLIAAWVGTWFVQGLLLLAGEVPRPHGPRLDVLGSLPIETIESVVFLSLAVVSAMVVYGAFSSGLMVFSIAHIDFLFPTPISRRKVLFVKLLKDYLKYAGWIAFFFFFIGSPIFSELGVSMMPWGLASIAAVVALVLLVINLAHTINIVFTFGYERLKQAGTLIKAAMVLTGLSALTYGVHQYARTGNAIASILWAADSPVVSAVFAPARWAGSLSLAPLLGITPEQWGQFGLLWLAAAGSFVLLMTRKENVYEPSLGISFKYGRRRLAMRSRDFTDIRVAALREKGTRRASGLSIPPFGRGAVAFVWKNILLRYRIYRSQLAFLILLPLVLIFILNRSLPAELKRNAPFLLAYMVWALSMAAQTEIRIDLKYANIVKSMPIGAWKLVLAQVASSVLYLAGGIAVFAGYLWIALPDARGPMLVACAVAAPFLGFANIAAMTIPSLMYPDLRDASQNYLCGLLGFLLTAIATAPTVVLGLVMHFVLRAPVYAILPAACAVNILIGAAAVALAGGMFRRFDPTSE